MLLAGAGVTVLAWFEPDDVVRITDLVDQSLSILGTTGVVRSKFGCYPLADEEESRMWGHLVEVEGHPLIVVPRAHLEKLPHEEAR